MVSLSTKNSMMILLLSLNVHREMKRVNETRRDNSVN